MIAFPIGLGVFYKDFLETDVLWKHRNIQVISFGVIWGYVDWDLFSFPYE